MTAVTSRIAEHAAARPDRAALVFGTDAITWRDLAPLLDRLAAYIAARVPAGGGVALHLPNSQALAPLTPATARALREAESLDPDGPAATVGEGHSRATCMGSICADSDNPGGDGTQKQ